MRVRSPPLERRATFPLNPPDLVADLSNSNSDSDQDHDQVMDVDGEEEMDDKHMADASLRPYDDESVGRGMGYPFGQSGSGGFGFGPGAEEDDESLQPANGNSFPFILR